MIQTNCILLCKQEPTKYIHKLIEIINNCNGFKYT